MKLFIPFDQYSSRGGPMTFMRNLKKYLLEKGYELSDNWHDGDSIFFPISYDLRVIKKSKKSGGKIIQRLDGVYYPSKHGLAHYLKNFNIRRIYKRYADFIIFQSEYSKAQCEELFGPVKCDYSIIRNGVDTRIFYPASVINNSREIPVLITTGVFRNVDMLGPVIDALDLISNEFKFELRVLGPITNPQLQSKLNRPYLNCLGVIDDQSEIAKELRNSDFFVYSHLNPPCPNSVMEAIASGLPVIGFDSGALKEMCSHQQELLAKTPNKVLHDLNDFNPRELADIFIKVFKNRKFYQEQGLNHKQNLSLTDMGDKYLEVFKKVIK